MSAHIGRTYWFVRSGVRNWPHILARSFGRSYWPHIGPFVRAFVLATYWSVRSFVRSYVRNWPHIGPFVRSFVRRFVIGHILVRSFVGS